MLLHSEFLSLEKGAYTLEKHLFRFSTLT